MADTPGGEQFEAIRDAQDLSELSEAFRTASIHGSYFRAKNIWKRVLREQQAQRPVPAGFAGRSVVVDGTKFRIHGITHAGTEPERAYLRAHVKEFLDQGGVVYCEQGIRSLYFDDFPAVCEMDDYLWARHRCDQLESDSQIRRENGFETMFEEIAAVTSQFREATFSLIESGSAMYGEQFERALGDIAAGFLTDHADLAVGKSYEAFQLSARASRNPDELPELQQYYERTFLPQPLEREWLRRHDPELELMSHARNERMADYAVYHSGGTDIVHLLVGAAHQPGVVYYLEQYTNGRELPAEFELF